jgi:hypothetical protein
MNSFKVLVKILLTALMAYLLQTMFPWWTIVIAGFSISFIVSTKGPTSFLGGFLGIGLLWFILASITDIRTDSILTARVAEIFSLPNSSLLILLTSIIGGLAGGFGALTGNQLRSWIMPPEIW